MKISFDQIWEEFIKPLQGNTVYTLKDNKPNKILQVTNEALTRSSENDSPPQTISKEVFQTVYNQIINQGEITRVEINAALPHMYSSIVCAVLAKIPTVGYDLKPIRLYKK